MKTVTVNYFAEHHGKSIVDGMFGRISEVFKKISIERTISSSIDLKNAFEDEYVQNNWKNVYFRLYTRKKRPKFINKLNVFKIKTILSYVFNCENSFFSYLTRTDGTYTPLNVKETVQVEKRSTTLTPFHEKASRVKCYFNDKIENLLKLRVEWI